LLLQLASPPGAAYSALPRAAAAVQPVRYGAGNVRPASRSGGAVYAAAMVIERLSRRCR
jgi:hypothetical protein